MTEVNCEGLKSAKVLAHLYNNAKPVGMGMFQYQATAMTEDEAEKELSKGTYFDYLKGRPLKTDFRNFPVLNSFGYDRDQGGEGTMKRLVDELKMSGEVDTNLPFKAPTDSELKETLDKCNAGLKISSFNPVSYGGKTPKEMKLQKFDQVHFTKDFCREIEKLKIPYPNDWHMYMDSSDGKARFVGSMGGGFSVGEDLECVSSKSSMF